MTVWRHLVLGFLLAVSLGAPSASAQAPGRRSLIERRAYALFESGMRSLEAGRAADARDDFRRSLALLPRTPTRFNLALALDRTGEFAEALFHLRQLLEVELNDAQRAGVEEQIRALEGRVGSLAIVVGATALTDGDVRVSIDAEDVGTLPIGEALTVEVDPGVHRVSARARASEADAEVTVTRGRTTPVQLELRAAAVTSDEPPWAWIGVGAGAVLVAAVIVITYFAIATETPSFDTAVNVETLRVRF